MNPSSDAANGIPCGGLQGSPPFDTSESSFHKLNSTIQSGEGGPRALRPRASQTSEQSVALFSANDVIRRFNRDTKRLATLVMGAVASVAFILAVLVQDRHQKAIDPTEEAVQAGGDRLLNVSSATLFKDVDLQGKKSAGEITTGQVRSVDHSFTEGSSKKNPSWQMEVAVLTPIPVLAFTPEINHINAASNASSWSPAHWQDPARFVHPKIRNVRDRLSLVRRSVDVKMRLVALWHKSLARSERSRSWIPFSNSNKDGKKVSYTAEANH